ncbi:FAD-binding oxidoreductase, partial [bacterium]
MDLRSDAAVWTRRAPLELSGGPMAGDVTCDVLVVGTGITGALAAHALVDAGLDVVMIDRRGLARGATAASTALIQYEVDVPLVELRATLGAADADSAYRQTRAALDTLRDVIAREAIDCDLRHRPTLYLGRAPVDADLFAREVAARRAIGIECELLDGRALRDAYGIDRPA